MTLVRHILAGRSARSVPRVLVPSLAFLFVSTSSHARDLTSSPSLGHRFHRPLDARTIDRARELEGLFTSSSVDTFFLGDWDFDTTTICSSEGWTSVDLSAQADLYWHVVDDTAAACLSTQVMWCGQEPTSEPPYCQWSELPGYGNRWKQYLRSQSFPVNGPIEVSFRGAWDTETGADFFRLQYDSTGTWVDRFVADGKSGSGSVCSEDLTFSITPVGLTRTKLRFCFESDEVNSDEDGFGPSAWGAASVDDILVLSGSDTAVAFENFEDETAGIRGVGDFLATEMGDTTWLGYVEPGVGDFVGFDAGLFEEDPCRDNFSCQLHFLKGSTNTSLHYPGQTVTPKDIYNQAISPKVDWDLGGSVPATASGVVFEFEVYKDLPLGASVFYQWGVRTYQTSAPNCPGPWRDRELFYYGPDKDFVLQREVITDLIEPDPDAIQVMVLVADYCQPFCVRFGFPGIPHTPSPSFDNIRLYRTLKNGPAWAFRAIDLFQDTFPEDGSTTGTARIDAANDINPAADPVNLPGDSLTVDCSAPGEGGLADNPLFYVRVVEGPDSGITGTGIEGDCGTWIGVENGWNCIRMDSARTTGGGVAEGKWAVDLNDSLFSAGDVLEYFFKATSNMGTTSLMTTSGVENIPGYDTTNTYHHPGFFEVTILPRKQSWSRHILYVDDFDMREDAENLIEWALDIMLGSGWDKYDVNGSTSGVGNGPGGRVKDLSQIQDYKVIIWNSGNLDRYTISDGLTDKGDDASLLRDYLNLTDHDVGLWVSGDDIAFDLNQSTQPRALDLLNNWCGVTWLSQSQYLLTGVTSPFLDAEPGSPWHGVASCSTHVVYGGCPDINRFDVLETNAGASYGFTWPGHNPGSNDRRGAVITNEQLNSKGSTARTIWQAYSLHYIRDDLANVYIDRACFLGRALNFFGLSFIPPVGVSDIPVAYALSQNNPNPFNPVTKITFSLPKNGEVSLVIYDVAGRRVRTLVDEFRKAGTYGEIWDGRNDAGRAVTSGVYFYRLTTPEFTDQRKMVLLK